MVVEVELVNTTPPSIRDCKIYAVDDTSDDIRAQFIDTPIHGRVSALRVNLYDCSKHPSSYISPIEPPNAIEKAWIPQTAGEQIWVLWLFETEEERIEFEESLPESVSRWLSRSLVSTAIPYGWHTRDINGSIL